MLKYGALKSARTALAPLTRVAHPGPMRFASRRKTVTKDPEVSEEVELKPVTPYVPPTPSPPPPPPPSVNFQKPDYSKTQATTFNLAPKEYIHVYDSSTNITRVEV